MAFMNCTSLNDIYLPTEFQVDAPNTFWDMVQKKCSGEITSKYEGKSYGSYALHFSLMIIYLHIEFHNDAPNNFRDMDQTKIRPTTFQGR